MKQYNTLGDFCVAVAMGTETRRTATPEEDERWRHDFCAAVAPEIERIRAEQRQAIINSQTMWVD
jgi:hypothetical protein